MSVAKVTEISSTSKKSFEDAINQGIARAGKTIRNIRSAWIKEQQVRCEDREGSGVSGEPLRHVRAGRLGPA